jgi:hypothetical protein
MSSRYQRRKLTREQRVKQTIEKQLDGQIRYMDDLKYYIDKVGEDAWARRSLEAVEQRVKQLREALDALDTNHPSV